MERTVKILSEQMPIDLYEATVIHANKYDRTTGGWNNLPVTSTLYTDVVFRHEESKQDWPITIVNIDLPVYTDQDVQIIVVKEQIVGYIDSKTYKYYYTTEDFHRLFRLGMDRIMMWIGVIASMVLAYFVGNAIGPWVAIMPIAVFVGYYLQKWAINYQVRRSLDRWLSGQ